MHEHESCHVKVTIDYLTVERVVYWYALSEKDSEKTAVKNGKKINQEGFNITPSGKKKNEQVKEKKTRGKKKRKKEIERKNESKKERRGEVRKREEGK